MKFPEKVSQSFTKFHKVSESFKKSSKYTNCVLFFKNGILKQKGKNIDYPFGPSPFTAIPF